MFYILQHKLCLQYSVGTPAYHAAAENTFLLALDGDVDFKPDAVLSLARRMKKSKQVGAACGRIHPIGTGMNIRDEEIWLWLCFCFFIVEFFY